MDSALLNWAKTSEIQERVKFSVTFLDKLTKLTTTFPKDIITAMGTRN